MSLQRTPAFQVCDVTQQANKFIARCLFLKQVHLIAELHVQGLAQLQTQARWPPRLRRRTSRRERPGQDSQQGAHPACLPSVQPKQAQRRVPQQLPQLPPLDCPAAPAQPAQALLSHPHQTLNPSLHCLHQLRSRALSPLRPRALQPRSTHRTLLKGRKPWELRRGRPGPARVARTALARAALPRPAPSLRSRRCGPSYLHDTLVALHWLFVRFTLGSLQGA